MSKNHITQCSDNHSFRKWLLTLSIIFVGSIFALTNAQTRITGTVTDAEGPMIGVTVKVKGTQIATQTDIDGKYTINVPANASALVFSFVSYIDKEETINGRTTINVTLESSATALTGVEIIADDGYRKIDRRLFTGVAERISGRDANIDGISDVSKAMQGRVSGVNVQSVSGTFGAAPKLQIRGASSIYGSTSPLWVIDGVIFEDLVQISADDLSSGDPATIISSAIAGLNADDIDDIQILKDASAVAMYGAKAMNGVIVVRTKKGKAGSVSVKYSGQFSFRLTPSYNDYNIMNSQEQMGVYRELESKGWLNYADVVSKSNSGVYGYMYALMETRAPNNPDKFLLENTDAAKAQYLRQAELLNTNWFKQLFRGTFASQTQEHSVSVSSGSERNRNYASLSIFNDPGWTVADKVQRVTGNFNSTTDILDNLTATMSMKGSYRKQQLPGTMDRNFNVASGNLGRSFDINPFNYALNTSRALNPQNFYRMNYAPFNELYELQNNYMDVTASDLSFQLDLSWKPIKELEVSGLVSYRYAISKTEHIINETSNAANAYRAAETSTIAKNNQYLYVDPENPVALPVAVLPEGGMWNPKENEISSFYSRVQANYNKTFADKHITNFFAGAEMRSLDRKYSFLNGWGYQWNQGGVPFIDYRIIKKQLEEDQDYYGLFLSWERALAIFGTASYSYLGKYTGSISGRIDGTNQLGKYATDRWLPTWTVSAGWRIKEESFLKDNKTISNLALRATYGNNAKPIPPGASALLLLYNGTPYRPLPSIKETMIYIGGNRNDNLTWEKNTEVNLGLDIGLWNRVSMAVDIYQRNGYDILSRVNTSAAGGQSIQWANNATIVNKGIEFSLGGRAIQTKDRKFSWDANATFAYNKNTVTKLMVSPRMVELTTPGGAYAEGYAGPGLFSYRFAGLSKEGYPQVYNEKGEIGVGNVFFQSRTGTENLKYEGPVDAPIQGGLNNTFTYKNWGLNVFFTYQFGGVMRLNPSYKSAYSDLDVMPKEMKNRWVLPGDEQITSIPVIPDRVQVYNNSDLSIAYMAYNYSTERVAATDFIRLKEVFLTYEIPAELIKQVYLTSAQLRLTVSNIALLYSDKRLNGEDPEFQRAGGVALPNAKQVTITLRLGL
ncbi:SusC/RagA family TonB-linked outer membrane protein [Bacteroidia bacterium]|nr:SusC/RagA family TonB-linked outer membrane protein [Bacteroidia bacterium]